MVRTKATPWHVEVRLPKCLIYITRNPVTFVIQRHCDLFLLDQQARERKHQAAYKRHVPQAACETCNYHYAQETLLITDVTRLQPFIAGGDSFRENIETLVSYNVQ